MICFCSISELLFQRMFKPLPRTRIFFKLSGMERKEKKILKVLHDFTDSVIIARRNELENKMKNNEKTDEIVDDVGSKKKLALLDVLLQSTIDGKPLSNMDIREEVDTFVFEGHGEKIVRVEKLKFGHFVEVSKGMIKKCHKFNRIYVSLN
jgi:cytochrome P450 family 4